MKNNHRPFLKAGLSRIAEIEFSIIPAIADIELAGIKIDLQKLNELKKNIIARLDNSKRNWIIDSSGRNSRTAFHVRPKDQL